MFPGVLECLPPGLAHIVQNACCNDDPGEVPLGHLEVGCEGVPVPFQLAKSVLDQDMGAVEAPVKVYLVGVQLPGVSSAAAEAVNSHIPLVQWVVRAGGGAGWCQVAVRQMVVLAVNEEDSCSSLEEWGSLSLGARFGSRVGHSWEMKLRQEDSWQVQALPLPCCFSDTGSGCSEVMV